jgi:hypothetical protein
VSEDREENNNDPQLQQLRDRVKELQQTYRAHREAGEKGKMQLALLEYDIAREELLRARSYRDNIHQKNKDRECHGRIACVCLPCLMCFQMLCCVSTAASGERKKTSQQRDATIAKVTELGRDLLSLKQSKSAAPKVKRMRR